MEKEKEGDERKKEQREKLMNQQSNQSKITNKKYCTEYKGDCLVSCH